MIEQQIPQFRQRLQLRPGLTGLAQSQLPADVALYTVRRKLKHDLYYIREVSPWLDLRIALSTVLYLVGVVLHMLGRRLVNRRVETKRPGSGLRHGPRAGVPVGRWEF